MEQNNNPGYRPRSGLVAFPFGLLMMASSTTSASLFLDALSAIPENSWGVISTNRYQDVWPDLAYRNFDVAHASHTPANIMNAWSSFAWDSNRGDLILYGGGHANYAGNEVYRWRSSTLEWERGSLPSQVSQIGNSTLYVAVDGSINAPASTHTYDNNLFLPVADRFVVLGGAAFNTGAPLQDENSARTGPYLWDPSKADPNKVGGTDDSDTNAAVFVAGGRMWENRNRTPSVQWDASYAIEAASEVVVENGMDVMYTATRGGLFRYQLTDINNPALDTLSRIGSANAVGGTWGHGPGSVDTLNKYFVRIANGGLYAYDLDTLSGFSDVINIQPILPDSSLWSPSSWLNGWGLDYDPVRGRFMLWNGQGELWSLIAPDDFLNGDWIMESVANFALPEFGLPNVWNSGMSGGGGVLGKWEYIPEFDVFLTTYDVFSGDIWAFKPSNWTGEERWRQNFPLTGVGHVSLPATAWLIPLMIVALFARNTARRERAVQLCWS